MADERASKVLTINMITPQRRNPSTAKASHTKLLSLQEDIFEPDTLTSESDANRKEVTKEFFG
jgi:hypothetical protein